MDDVGSEDLCVATSSPRVLTLASFHGFDVEPHQYAVASAGTEPVLVDTGTLAKREHWLEDVFSLVEPSEVRWVFLSHEDPDHIGNLAPVLDACPNATLVTTWAASGQWLTGLPSSHRDGAVVDRTLIEQQPDYVFGYR